MNDSVFARNDEETEEVARALREQVRALNYATAGPPGLTLPGTVYTVLGNVCEAVHGLSQTCEQLEDFLGEELDAGNLGHDRGDDPVPAILQTQDALAEAMEHTQDLSNALAAAQAAMNAVHARGTQADGVLTDDAESIVQNSTGGDIAALDFPDQISDLISRGHSPPQGAPGNANWAAPRSGRAS